MPCPVCRQRSAWDDLCRHRALRLPPWPRWRKQHRRLAGLRAIIHAARRWMPVVNGLNALALAVVDCYVTHRLLPHINRGRGGDARLGRVVMGMRLLDVAADCGALVCLWRRRCRLHS